MKINKKKNSKAKTKITFLFITKKKQRKKLSSKIMILSDNWFHDQFFVFFARFFFSPLIYELYMMRFLSDLRISSWFFFEPWTQFCISWRFANFDFFVCFWLSGFTDCFLLNFLSFIMISSSEPRARFVFFDDLWILFLSDVKLFIFYLINLVISSNFVFDDSVTQSFQLNKPSWKHENHRKPSRCYVKHSKKEEKPHEKKAFFFSSCIKRAY